MEKKRKIILLSCLSVLLIGLFYTLFNFFTVSNLKTLEIKDNLKNDDYMVMELALKPSKFVVNNETWCYVSKNDNDKNIKWFKAQNNLCQLEVAKGNYFIYLKNKYGYIKKVASKDVDLNKVKNVTFSKSMYYVPVNGSEEFKINFEAYGIVDTNIKYYVIDDTILKIDGNKFLGLKKGEVTVVANISNKTVEAKVNVMDSIREPEIDSKKNYVKCNQFSNEDAILLDKALEDRIKSAGYQTRAGAVAAARFLGLEFSYKIPYFYENGRLENYDVIKKVDGEGRYYHKGLYLAESKFKDISHSFKGPAIWGCPLMNLMEEGRYKAGVKYPNGLDCSGFISWALYNGGFDIGDVGAGDNPYRDDDLYDLGELRDTSMELINSGEVKVGDLIAYWGHMAMIVGMDEKNLYIAESLPQTKGVVIKKYTKVYAMDLFENIILMDSVYKEDGNLTNYWE